MNRDPKMALPVTDLSVSVIVVFCPLQMHSL